MNFDQYFKSGSTDKVQFGDTAYEVTFRSLFAGTIHLNSKVAVQGKDFPEEDLSGTSFPVDIAIAKHNLFEKFNPEHRELVSFVRIICKDSTPVIWKTACNETDASMVRVNTGYLNISHPNYVLEMKEIKKLHPEIEEFADIVKLAFDPTTNPPINFETLEDTGYTSFRKINGYESMDIESGFGDGTYTIYKGMDEKGDVCRIVCDFEITNPTNWAKYILS